MLRALDERSRRRAAREGRHRVRVGKGDAPRAAIRRRRRAPLRRPLLSGRRAPVALQLGAEPVNVRLELLELVVPQRHHCHQLGDAAIARRPCEERLVLLLLVVLQQQKPDRHPVAPPPRKRAHLQLRRRCRSSSSAAAGEVQLKRLGGLPRQRLGGGGGESSLHRVGRRLLRRHGNVGLDEVAVEHFLRLEARELGGGAVPPGDDPERRERTNDGVHSSSACTSFDVTSSSARNATSSCRAAFTASIDAADALGDTGSAARATPAACAASPPPSTEASAAAAARVATARAAPGGGGGGGARRARRRRRRRGGGGRQRARRRRAVRRARRPVVGGRRTRARSREARNLGAFAVLGLELSVALHESLLLECELLEFALRAEAQRQRLLWPDGALSGSRPPRGAAGGAADGAAAAAAYRRTASPTPRPRRRRGRRARRAARSPRCAWAAAVASGCGTRPRARAAPTSPRRRRGEWRRLSSPIAALGSLRRRAQPARMFFATSASGCGRDEAPLRTVGASGAAESVRVTVAQLAGGDAAWAAGAPRRRRCAATTRAPPAPPSSPPPQAAASPPAAALRAALWCWQCALRVGPRPGGGRPPARRIVARRARTRRRVARGRPRRASRGRAGGVRVCAVRCIVFVVAIFAVSSCRAHARTRFADSLVRLVALLPTVTSPRPHARPHNCARRYAAHRDHP